MCAIDQQSCNGSRGWKGPWLTPYKSKRSERSSQALEDHPGPLSLSEYGSSLLQENGAVWRVEGVQYKTESQESEGPIKTD
jgi:hypothetical protein